MGEVWKARDPRLGRDVAIKVLPSSLSADPDRLRRFEQEARAAGALNHPSITAVFDIGTHEGSLYVVSELLEGETLRGRLAAGPLAPRKAADFAAQIARGLAAAHEKGIVHRDLKPENLFVTRDSRVKILDFGLAVWRPLDAAGREQAAAAQHPMAGNDLTALSTAIGSPNLTEPGVVLGTVGYMSPEQVRGQVVDTRSDIFSFGAVLYEMLTGRRAFRGESAADTLSAILMTEPADLSETGRDIPPALDRIVRHCLEKSPEDRFQSARDLAFDLESLSTLSRPEAATAGEPVAAPPRPRRPLGPALAGVLLLAVIAAASFFLGERAGKNPIPSFQRLTYRRGHIWSARFAPDGRTVVYGAAWDGKPVQLFSTRPGSPESIPFALPGADVLAISSSGELALSLGRHYIDFWEASGTLARVALSGNAPREIAENVLAADWAPNGSDLAVVHSVGARMRLEYPIGNSLYETFGWIGNLRVSHDGNSVAFVDHPLRGDDTGSLVLMDRTGERKALSGPWSSVQGIAWAPDGQEIWFTASAAALVRTLRAVTLSGRSRLIANSLGTLHDISSDGRALVGRDVVRTRLLGLPPGEAREREFSWLDSSIAADLSADGTTLLFAEEGEGGGGVGVVYFRKTDGSPPVRLGEGYALALSPDKKWALAAPINFTELLLLPTGTGQAKKLERGGIESYQSARFLPDSKRILFAGKERGRRARLYIQDPDGGGPRAITPEGAGAAFRGNLVSPDGRFVTGPGADKGFDLYPVEGGSPIPIPGLEEGEVPIQWSADQRSLYVYRPVQDVARVSLLDLSSGRRTPWKDLIPFDPAGSSVVFQVAITPDGKSYIYSYGQMLSDLFLVEGLK